MENDMRKFLFTIIAALVLICGCTSGESPAITGEVMEFNAAYPSSTRASGQSFEDGDKIGIYISEYEDGKPVPLKASGNFKNNNPAVFDGRRWACDPVIYWGEGTYDVFAYYPYLLPDIVDEMPFNVATNQDEETSGGMSGYEASDFLHAAAKGVTREDGTVKLSFRHIMSNLTINLIKGEDFSGELPYDVTVMVHNTVTDCYIDLATGDVVKNPRARAKTIVARKTGQMKYSAVIVPQMIEYKVPLVEIACSGVSYMIESIFNFRSGTQHIINVTLDKNSDKVKIDIGGEVPGGWD